MVTALSLAAGAAFVGSRAYAQSTAKLPALAQVINQKNFNVLKDPPPPLGYNASSAPWTPPGYTQESLLAKPFHVYDDEFLAIIGDNPTFSLIASTPKDPVFHEAIVWFKPTDEVFFAQNVGNPDAGTGLKKSAIIQKISLKEAEAVKNERNATGKVKVTEATSNPQIPNPNGATQWKGQLLYAAEGQGDNKPAALIALNPRAPYNTTVILNNFFGRQFNSLNDLTVHPKNLDVYFTDPTYGATQDFRPAPGLQNQVYRLNDKTGAVTVVADGFEMPNGITFSPDGKYAYVSDSGIWKIGLNLAFPSSIYRFNVAEDGTFENRKTFAFIDINIPDGLHTDSKGNLYAGVGDGVQVFNPSGKLIGKIYTGRTAANFQFVGGGRIVIAGETHLYYATVAAQGALVEQYL